MALCADAPDGAPACPHRWRAALGKMVLRGNLAVYCPSVKQGGAVQRLHSNPPHPAPRPPNNSTAGETSCNPTGHARAKHVFHRLN